ncbi:hypothetical protein [Streptomyces microflavus]
MICKPLAAGRQFDGLAHRLAERPAEGFSGSVINGFTASATEPSAGE